MRRVALGVVALLATSATAGIEHTILNGVSIANVRSVVGPGALPGVTPEALVTRAEARLKEAGVRRSARSDADLVIGLAVFTGDSGSCFVTVDGRLVEQAKLERNGLRVDAASWSSGSTVVVDAAPGAPTGGPAAPCSKLALEAADHVVRDFVEHYRAMNPGAGPAGK